MAICLFHDATDMAVKIIDTLLKLSSKVIPHTLYLKLIQRDRYDVFYHVISDEDLAYIRHLYPVIPVEDFCTSLDYLASHYSFVTYQQVHDHILNGTMLPENALHLSVDDGYRQCFDIVRPLLLERNIPATFFLTTSLIDNRILFYRNKVSLAIDKILHLQNESRSKALAEINNSYGLNMEDGEDFRDWIKELRLPDESIIDEVLQVLHINVPVFLAEERPYLTRHQIQLMHADGFTIGAHTVTHRKLGTLDDEDARREIVESCRLIREITGQEVVPLSFPHSGANLSRDLLQEIRANNPWIGLFFDTKGLKEDIPIVVNRIWGERSLQANGRPSSIQVVIANAYQEQWPRVVKNALRWGG